MFLPTTTTKKKQKENQVFFPGFPGPRQKPYKGLQTRQIKHNFHPHHFSPKARNCPPLKYIKNISEKSDSSGSPSSMTEKNSGNGNTKEQNGLCKKILSFCFDLKKKKKKKLPNIKMNLFNHDKDAVDLCQPLDYNHKY